MTTDVDPRVIRRIADMHAVYRMFDKDRHLLYIGRTKNAGQRFGDHNMKRWFPLVETIELEWFGTRAEAGLAERRAIRNERPRYNIAETPRSRQVKVRYVEAPPAEVVEIPVHRSPRNPNRHLTATDSIPARARAVLTTLLAREGGITTRKAAPILGVTVWTARCWLERLRSEGAAQVYGTGRAAHWRVPNAESGDGS